MDINQEPKYCITNGQLCVRSTGLPIPKDEPVFIFRAKDKLAIKALEAYAKQLIEQDCCPNHLAAVAKRIKDFRDFSESNENQMKYPDTKEN